MSRSRELVARAGKTRDADGTVDRVPDPPEALNKWLLVLKLKNKSAMIDIPGILRQAGGTPMGIVRHAAD